MTTKKRHDWAASRTLVDVEVCLSCGLRRKRLGRIWELWTTGGAGERLTTQLPSCPTTEEEFSQLVQPAKARRSA